MNMKKKLALPFEPLKEAKMKGNMKPVPKGPIDTGPPPKPIKFRPNNGKKNKRLST
jgi:hypothetical protein